jgi:N utilization substance protein A
MERIKLGPEEIKFITLFEGLTGSKVKDCLIEENGGITFVVEEKELGRCLGKEGRNIKRFRALTGRSVHVVGYSSDLSQFVRNIFSPAEIARVLLSGDGKTVTVEVKPGFKGMALGEGKRKLSRARKLVGRFFGVRDMVVKTSAS